MEYTFTKASKYYLLFSAPVAKNVLLFSRTPAIAIEWVTYTGHIHMQYLDRLKLLTYSFGHYNPLAFGHYNPSEFALV